MCFLKNRVRYVGKEREGKKGETEPGINNEND